MASIATDEDVVNLALARIGSSSISDLDNDDTPQAAAARRVYYNARDRLIRSHPWNFLAKRAQLTDSGSDPTFGWDEGYLLPNDYVRIVSVHATDDETDQPPYRIERQSIGGTDTDVLLINSSTCYVRYVYLEADPSKWTEDFQSAVAWAVAAELALILPVSGTDFDRLQDQAKRALLYAKSVDGQEDYPDRIPAGSWVTDRSAEHDNWGD